MYADVVCFVFRESDSCLVIRVESELATPMGPDELVDDDGEHIDDQDCNDEYYYGWVSL